MTAPAQLPHDTDAERATLGCILLNRDAIEAVIAVLGDDLTTFYIQSHQVIYSAVLDLYRDQEPVDLIILCDRLRENGDLETAGGVSYVGTISDAVQTSSNAKYYAEIVYKEAQKRIIANHCKRALRDIQGAGARPDDVLQNLVAVIRDGRPEQIQIDAMRDWEELSQQEVDSVFERGLFVGKMGVLTAEGGTGKSFMALQLALSVALDLELIDGFKPTMAGRVLCCFGEDDNLVVSRRMKAIATELLIGHEHINGALRFGKLSFLNASPFPLLATDSFGAIQRTAKFMEFRDRVAREKYRLIIIDPLVAWAGIPNENDNAAMQAVAGAIIDLAQASNAAVLVIHHANKAGNRTGDMSQASGRGASSLQDAARWVASMRQFSDRDMKEYRIEGEDRSQYVALHVSKNSYAPRSAEIVTLTRMRGGVLKPINLGQTKSTLIADFLVEAMGDLPKGTGVSPNGLYRKEGEIPSLVRAGVDERAGYSVTREAIESAVSHCITNGLLEFRPAPKLGPGRRSEWIYLNDF